MTIATSTTEFAKAQEKFEGMSLSDIFSSLETRETSQTTQTQDIAPSMVATDGQGRITDAISVRAFVLGGNATFTIVSVKTGTRFTFKVRAPKDGDGNFSF